MTAIGGNIITGIIGGVSNLINPQDDQTSFQYYNPKPDNTGMYLAIVAVIVVLIVVIMIIRS